MVNFNADSLWKIKSSIIMKKLYSIYSGYFYNNSNITLYKFGI